MENVEEEAEEAEPAENQEAEPSVELSNLGNLFVLNLVGLQVNRPGHYYLHLAVKNADQPGNMCILVRHSHHKS